MFGTLRFLRFFAGLLLFAIGIIALVIVRPVGVTSRVFPIFLLFLVSLCARPSNIEFELAKRLRFFGAGGGTCKWGQTAWRWYTDMCVGLVGCIAAPRVCEWHKGATWWRRLRAEALHEHLHLGVHVRTQRLHHGIHRVLWWRVSDKRWGLVHKWLRWAHMGDCARWAVPLRADTLVRRPRGCDVFMSALSDDAHINATRHGRLILGVRVRVLGHKLFSGCWEDR